MFVVVCAVCWMLNPDAWIADDSYFYLVIARNIAWEGVATFSGIIPTNGFHPLWGWLLGLWAKIVEGISPDWLLSPRFGVLLAFSCLLLSAEVYRRLVALLELPALTFVLPVAFTAYFGVLYSEGHLSLLALATLCLVTLQTCRKPVFWRLLLLGLVATLAVLARLDNLFVAASILMYAWFSTQRRAGAIALAPAGVFLVFIGLYMAFNSAWYGGYMPVSGWMKSSFPTVSIQGFHGGSNPSFGGVPLLWGWGAMLVAAGICIRIHGEAKNLLTVLLLGVVAKNTYIALFTRSHTGWYWYSTLDVFVLTIALSAWASQHSIRWNYARSGLHGIAAICCVGMIAKALAWSMPQDSRPARGLSLILNNTVSGNTVLVSDWPGYVAFYAADRHIVAADMLTANRRWYMDLRRNENAFEFIRASCSSAGKPLTHVLWNGNSWLVPRPDNRTIDFNDPRTYPVESRIGVIELAADPIAASGDSTLWRLQVASGS